ncbi:transposase [Reichenbachiella sp.]|uniref:transposase n=1 Tax=Reichenbachiella sp. TaxID=2184521 RepID=UPI003B5A05BB
MLTNHLYFFTASILNWKRVLAYDPCKQIILDSLQYLHDKKAVKICAFVIMPNHIHLIWMPLKNNSIKNLQLSFMKFTAQKIKFFLQDNESEYLEEFLVNKNDRTYQIWQRDSLAVELYSPKVIEQKLDYIHNNPCQGKWLLAD